MNIETQRAACTCYRCKTLRCQCEDHTTIIHGDNVAVMQTFDADMIDLVVTSPPYDNLRSYLTCELVVLRYNVPHDQKQKIIKELEAAGVAPVATP